MKLFFYKVVTLVLIASLLQACGFRLRGSSELPNTIKFAVIDGVAQYSDIGLAIKQQLETSGAKVLTKPDVDTFHFVVLKNEFFKRVLSVDASGRANEYELTYQFSMRVLDGKGKVLVNERAINLNRNYLYDINSALAKSDEEASIKLQMIALAVRQSMRRIGIKLRQVTATTNNNASGTGHSEGSNSDPVNSEQSNSDSSTKSAVPKNSEP